MSTYSKKVMEHFANPRNYGEMINPDGLGKFGNPVCLLPDEKVNINDHFESIKNITVENHVLSHNGSFEKISDKSERNYTGKILTLKNKLGAVSVTPEHMVYAIIKPPGDKFLRTEGKKTLTPYWVHAEDLKKGDIAVYPILNDIKDIDFISVEIEKYEADHRSKDIPDKIPISNDFLKLSGLFLAEGNIREETSKNYIVFTLNLNEKSIAAEIQEIVKRIFDLDSIVTERPEHHSLQIDIYSCNLARTFKKLFGNYADQKSIPHFMMLLPLEKQKSLIHGLWLGDGCINLKRRNPRGGYVTISYKLAQQLKTLLLRQHVIPSMYSEEAKIIDNVSHRKCYRVHVGDRDSLIKLCEIMGQKYSSQKILRVHSWFDENYAYTPISSIQINEMTTPVYNLEVENEHSFTTEAFCLHNCGDIMWIYIKVNPETEVIEDIKFKTFGCAAAIATSSMITELARGKTIKEAYKITRKDVADSLDGLPPIKMHCSNLAADALQRAIEDYLTKKGRSVTEFE